MTKTSSRATRMAAIAAFMLAGTAQLATVPPVRAAPSAPAMTAIADYGAYRIEGVRDGTFQGEPVRIVDITLVNHSTETTFPGTIIELWWQGKNTGREVVARHRDLTDRNKFEYIKPGQTWLASYAVPVRADIGGVILRFSRGKGMPERKLTWADLEAGAR